MDGRLLHVNVCGDCIGVMVWHMQYTKLRRKDVERWRYAECKHFSKVEWSLYPIIARWLYLELPSLFYSNGVKG